MAEDSSIGKLAKLFLKCRIFYKHIILMKIENTFFIENYRTGRKEFFDIKYYKLIYKST